MSLLFHMLSRLVTAFLSICVTSTSKFLYMEDLYKKDLNEVDYYNGVVSHPEPDILECKVKWALRSTLLIKLVNAMKFQEVTHTESQFPYV